MGAVQDVDMYILKCISQYGDNQVGITRRGALSRDLVPPLRVLLVSRVFGVPQFFGKFKQLYPDSAEIVTEIPSSGRRRNITIGPRPPVGSDHSSRSKPGASAVISGQAPAHSLRAWGLGAAVQRVVRSSTGAVTRFC